LDAPDLEPDSRSKLERHALGNVRRLYEKLDDKDKLDRRTERKFTIGAAATVAAAIAVMTMAAVMRSPDAGAQERARCVQAARVEAVWQFRKELGEKHPEMGSAETSKLVESHFREVKSVATSQCDAGFPKGR